MDKQDRHGWQSYFDTRAAAEYLALPRRSWRNSGGPAGVPHTIGSVASAIYNPTLARGGSPGVGPARLTPAQGSSRTKVLALPRSQPRLGAGFSSSETNRPAHQLSLGHIATARADLLF